VGPLDGLDFPVVGRGIAMIHYIWAFLIISGIVVAALQGNIEVIVPAAFRGAKEALLVCVGLVTVLAFWLGLMRIAEDAGLLKKLGRWIAPVIRLLFPDVPKDHPAIGYIVSNVSANLFGLGNAATPMGIKAMKALQDLNPDKQTASAAMCTLLAINTSGMTIIPTMILGIRMEYGSQNPTEIIGTTLFATCCATVAAVLLDKWFRSRHTR
jgi:spore maturation protein A